MITLHHVAASRSFRTLWLLEELELPYDIQRYRITDGSLRTADYMAKSPAGRVPALDIDGASIFESAAIAEYLCETFPEHGLGRLAGEAERISFLQWLSYAETQASIVAQLNLQMVFLRPPAKPSPASVKLDVARLRASLVPIEEQVAQTEWLLPGGFSAADTMLGFNLFAVGYFVDLAPFSAIQSYIARMEARPAFQRAREKDGPQEFYQQSFYPVPEA